jgi:hypothetical protein
MDIVAVWIIYFILIVVLWVGFWYSCSYTHGYPCAIVSLFYALIIGFLFIYLILPFFDVSELSIEEQSWYHALSTLSVLLPALIVGIMIAQLYLIRMESHLEENKDTSCYSKNKGLFQIHW